jgi:hypothetical protein
MRKRPGRERDGGAFLTNPNPARGGKSSINCYRGSNLDGTEQDTEQDTGQETGRDAGNQGEMLRVSCRGKGERAMSKRGIWIAAGLMTAVTLAGCRVNVNKDQNGQEKQVQVDTPFGGLHVNTGQTSAADLGLPVYPGATAFVNDDTHKSADVHMGFGEWQLRVRAVSYATTDDGDKVAEFYKKALGRYGDVLTCKNKQAVGTPTVTAEGLTCQDDNGHGVNVDVDSDNDKKKGVHINIHEGIELKAGSKRHQHIVGVHDQKEDGKTVFEMVALDLPAGVDKGN